MTLKSMVAATRQNERELLHEIRYYYLKSIVICYFV